MIRRRRLALLMATSLLAVGGFAAGCGDDDDDDASGDGGGDLSGTIIVDGSSTVFPLSSAAGEAYNGEESGVRVDVRSSGTGGGFEVFCAGETDISDASRPIDEEEIAACESNGVAYTEVRVATDGLTVVTGADSPIEGDISIEQLAAIWGPDSKISNWSDVPGGSFPDAELSLAGPDTQSGTYDFFNEEVLGEDAAGETISPRQDYQASADDNVIVTAVAGAEAGLAHFGYSYYIENTDQVKALNVDGVEPTPASITAGDYPLSRPLLIYVSNASLAKPEVAGFVNYYVDNAISLAESQDFIPATQEELDGAKEAITGASGGAAGSETTEDAGTETTE